MMYAVYKNPRGGQLHIAYNALDGTYLFARTKHGNTEIVGKRGYTSATKAQRELDYFADRHELRFLYPQDRIEKVYLDHRSVKQ